jgi:hypothetical protein
VVRRPRRLSPAREPSPGVPIAALVRVGHEVALRARRLGTGALSVEIAGHGRAVFFSAEAGRVWAVGRGYELELSALPEWERDRPPGA